MPSQSFYKQLPSVRSFAKALQADSKREVHFIDGADGGYALAAKHLKAQMKQLS